MAKEYYSRQEKIEQTNALNNHLIDVISIRAKHIYEFKKLILNICQQVNADKIKQSIIMKLKYNLEIDQDCDFMDEMYNKFFIIDKNLTYEQLLQERATLHLIKSKYEETIAYIKTYFSPDISISNEDSRQAYLNNKATNSDYFSYGEAGLLRNPPDINFGEIPEEIAQSNAKFLFKCMDLCINHNIIFPLITEEEQNDIIMFHSIEGNNNDPEAIEDCEVIGDDDNDLVEEFV